MNIQRQEQTHVRCLNCLQCSAGVYSALSSTASIPQNSTLRLHTKLDPGLGLGEGEARTAFNEDQVNRLYFEL